MEIRLHNGNWYINGYVIEKDNNIDYYNVYATGAEDGFPLFGNESFEKCLTWCYNN